MSESQSKPADGEVIGLVPDEFANELYEFTVQCESADEAKQGELIKEMAEKVVKMIERDPENRDKIISRLWFMSDIPTGTSELNRLSVRATRLILQNRLASQVLYLITDPERKTEQVKRKRGFLARVLKRKEGKT